MAREFCEVSMSTETVSADRVESTRKTAARIQAAILQRLAAVTQERAAACMGVSASTVSRAVTDDLERVCQILAALGLQAAPVDSMVVSRDEMRALERMACKYLQIRLQEDDV